MRLPRTTWQWRIQHCAENFTPRFCFDKKNIERKEKEGDGRERGRKEKRKEWEGKERKRFYY